MNVNILGPLLSYSHNIEIQKLVDIHRYRNPCNWAKTSDFLPRLI